MFIPRWKLEYFLNMDRRNDLNKQKKNTNNPDLQQIYNVEDKKLSVNSYKSWGRHLTSSALLGYHR